MSILQNTAVYHGAGELDSPKHILYIRGISGEVVGCGPDSSPLLRQIGGSVQLGPFLMQPDMIAAKLVLKRSAFILTTGSGYQKDDIPCNWPRWCLGWLSSAQLLLPQACTCTQHASSNSGLLSTRVVPRTGWRYSSPQFQVKQRHMYPYVCTLSLAFRTKSRLTLRLGISDSQHHSIGKKHGPVQRSGLVD